MGNLVYSFIVNNPDHTETVEHARPRCDADDAATGSASRIRLPRAAAGVLANVFKIPTLWAVARTAPYFHDNSAKTLEQVAEHYAFYFRTGQLRFKLHRAR